MMHDVAVLVSHELFELLSAFVRDFVLRCSAVGRNRNC